MNKEKQIRKRTWKYFREQKWKEVKEFFEDVFPFILPISISFGLCCQLFWIIDPDTGESVCPIIAIIGLYILGFWVLIGLIALFKVIKKWLKSNWKKAKKKAEKDFK